MATPSHGQLLDSAPAVLAEVSKKNSGEKPLPSPPIAQVVKVSPTKEARSLIDASEKPLRRSPPGMPHHEEEWPVLFPEKPKNPGTLPQMTHRDSAGGSPKSIKPQQERYPVLSSAAYHPMTDLEKSTNMLPPMWKIQRKEVSSIDSRIPLSTSLDRQNTGVLVATKMKETEEELNTKPNLLAVEGVTMTWPSDRSSGTAAVGKFTDSKPISQPRQTRTSSLRARLSAGQLINGPAGESKPIGLTNFNGEIKLIAPPNKGSARVRGPHNRSVSPLGAHSHAKTSRDSVHGHRAPAQFVAGSRRPIHRRPSSRGNLRSDSRASSPPLVPRPPSRSAPETPNLIQGLHEEAMNDTVMPKNDGQRRSSIPVLRPIASNTIDSVKDGHVVLLNEKAYAHSQDISRNEFSIYEDKLMHYPTALQAIKESPRLNYKTKRLSMTSPEHGPILRISPSAERLIMGSGSDKENQPDASKNQSNDIQHDPVASSIKNVKDRYASTVLKKPVPRPSSSQGLPQFTFRRGLVDAESRQKKVKSADMSYSPPVINVAQHSMPLTKHTSRKPTRSSTPDDPFYDMATGSGSALNRVGPIYEAQTEARDEDLIKSSGEDSWISPLVNHHSISWSNATPVHSEYLPATLQEHLSKEIQGDHEGSAVQTDFCEATNDSGNPIADVGKVNKILGFPVTPTQIERAAGTFHSDSFPPRSSSHATHPDHTVNGSAISSPLSSVAKTNNVWQKSPPRPEVDSATASTLSEVRRHELAVMRILSSSQGDNGASTSKRDSTARDSSKSQGSMSKGMISNFRGLFNKRSSNNTEPAFGKPNKKDKQARVTSAGSPFPKKSEPTSKTQPLHRPTLASTNRSKSVAADTGNHGPATPSLASPIPSGVYKTTALAMEILDLARSERSPRKQQRFLELGRIMVDAATQARDVEKAMEEAKQAARKAEMACTMCMKSLDDVARSVEQWRDEVAMM